MSKLGESKMESTHPQTVRKLKAYQIQKDWATNDRWNGVKRPYTAEDVVNLQGSQVYPDQFAVDQANKLWNLLNTESYVNTLGALTGMQALQQVKAGLKAIYLSGWQVAGDANLAGEMYPDQSLYPADSVPAVVNKINNNINSNYKFLCLSILIFLFWPIQTTGSLFSSWNSYFYTLNIILILYLTNVVKLKK